MPDDLDPLTQAMIDAGLFPEQMQQVQRQYGMGQQFMQTPSAQGAHVGNTYVASSPLEHASNAIRQFLGAKMAGSAMQRERDLTAQLGAGRQKFAQAMQNTGGKTVAGDYGEPLSGVGADPQRAQQLMMMGAASGDPAMQHAAQMYMQEQNQARQMALLQNTIRHQHELEAQGWGRVGQGQERIEQSERSQRTQFDPLGNRVTTPTHAPKPGSLLPLSTVGAPTPKTPWSPDALDKDAEMLAVSGDYKKMPGKIGAAYDLAVRKRSTELYPEASRAGNKADYASNVNSLRKLQVAQDSLESFEKGMLQNGRLMLDTAKGLVDTGSPFFNKPVRAWKFQAGDPNAAKFNAARQVFVQEAGKVLGGAVQGGGITEGQRHEAEALMRGDMTLPQMEATLQTLEADATNRRTAAAQQIEAIRGRMSGKPAPVAPPAPAEKKVLKYQQNKAKGVKRAVYSDGSYGPNEPL